MKYLSEFIITIYSKKPLKNKPKKNMDSTFSICSIKLAYQDKIFRLSSLPKTFPDLEFAFKKYFSQDSFQITCKTPQNEDIEIDSKEKYYQCLNYFIANEAKAIKFVAKNLHKSNKSSKEHSLADEKETFDSKMKSLFCTECSEILGNALETALICLNCQKVSKNLSTLKELKKFAKSLSPPISEIHDNPRNPFRKKSHTCTFEQKKEDYKERIYGKNAEFQAKIINSQENEFIFNDLRKNEFYELKINFVNIGNKKWPKNLQLRCISGELEGIYIGVRSLEMEEDCEVKINLKAPNSCGRFHLAWRLGYEIGNNIKYFGPRILNELYVSEK